MLARTEAGEVAWEAQSRSALLNVRSIFSFPVSLANRLATVLALRYYSTVFPLPNAATSLLPWKRILP